MSSTIWNGDSRSVSIDTGKKLSVVAVSGTYTVLTTAGIGAGTALATNATGGTYGPYAGPITVLLTSSALSEVDYDVAVTPVVVSDTVVTASTNPLTGGIAISANGETRYVNEAAETYQLPPATTRITASQTVVGKAVKLVSVECISAAAIALTIYDNGTTNAGTVLFSQTMSTGDKAIIPTPTQAINGLYASFTGTATFDIGAQDVA